MSDRDPEANLLARRRRQLGLIAVVAVLAAAAGLLAGTFVRSPAQVAAETAAPAKTPLTAAVEQRSVVETIVARGEAQVSSSVELSPGTPPEGMKPIVTRVAVGAGDNVGSGQVLLEVAERPTFVLEGSVPMYRDIQPGDTGKDVAQLQQSLRDVGWYIGDQEGVNGPSTQAAVVQQYARMGYRPLRAEVEPVEQDVAGDDAKDSKSSSPKAKAPAPPLVGGPIVPMGECFFVSKLPAVVSALSVRPGSVIEGPAVTLSAKALTVRADLNPVDAEALTVGQKVRIQDESGELDVAGRVADIGATRVDETGGRSIPVVVKPRKRLQSRWAAQPMRVSFPMAQAPDGSLVVPLAAVRSSVDGQTQITKLDGTRRIKVDVGVGPRGDGYIEVKPAGSGSLKVGDRVLLGS